MISLFIVALLFVLSGWLLWKAVGEDPDEFDRQAAEARDAWADFKRTFIAALKR